MNRIPGFFLPLLLALPAMCLATEANAEVFKCRNASGDMVYQDHPCNEETTSKDFNPPALGVTDNVSGASEHGWVGTARQEPLPPRCMNQDGRWRQYDGASCEPAAEPPQSGEERRFAAERWRRCVSLRSQPEKLAGTRFSDFRAVCDLPPDARHDGSAGGAKWQWVFRKYDLYIYTQGDLIVSAEQR